MAANDRIKDIATIRKWIREFSLFGEKTRTDFTDASGYRHALEKAVQLFRKSGYLNLVRDENLCQHVFFSMDARDVERNPLFAFYKIHYFKENDLKLHFFLMSVLSAEHYLPFAEIFDALVRTSLYSVDEAVSLDSTLRRKLKEYEEIGVCESQGRGRRVEYGLRRDGVALEPWRYAVPFFSEVDPLGVVGDFLRDRMDRMGILPESPFLFRHHYLHHVLDAEIVAKIADAMRTHSSIVLVNATRDRNGTVKRSEFVPLYFYHSVQTGRHYVAGCQHYHYALHFARLDRIVETAPGSPVEDYAEYRRRADRRLAFVWGVSDPGYRKTTHLAMVIHVPSPDCYALRRLYIERRHGQVERIDDCTARFRIDVWDAREMLPWVRTFIGYIASLECTDRSFVEVYEADLESMRRMYY